MEDPGPSSALGEDPFLQGLVHCLDDAVVVRDAGGCVVLANNAARELFDAKSPELGDLGGDDAHRPLWDVVRTDGSILPRDEHPAVLAAHTASTEGPVVIGARRVDGTRGWFSVRAVPVCRSNGGAVTVVLTILQDVTVQRRSLEIDEAILDMAHRLAVAPLDDPAPAVERHLAELTRLGGTDRSLLLGVDLEVGEMALDLQWPSEDDARNTTIPAVPLDVAAWLVLRLARHETVSVADLSELPDEASLIRQLFAEWGIAAFVAVPIMRGGRLHRCLLLSWTEPVVTIDESVARLAGLAGELLSGLEERGYAEAVHRRAASDSRILREQSATLSETNEELLRASRSKDEFLATMSHELRTPLAAVLGLAEMLEDGGYGALTSRQLAAVGTIESSGQHLLDLIDDLLDLSQIEARMTRVVPELIQLGELCEEALDLVAPRAEQEGISLSFEVVAGCDFIEADPRRLKQILLNLLDNALKFTEEGGSIGLDVMAPDADHLAFTVWDTGIGIDPALQARLFQPFVQADQGSSRRYEGTGMGLALVARLTELHGGLVEVESRPGAGSRFTVVLPRGASDPGSG